MIANRHVALMLCAAAVAGCANSSQPHIRVLHATEAERTNDAVRYLVALEIANPGTESVRLEEFAYRATVNGISEAEMIRSAQATLGPLDVRQVTLPVIVPLSADAEREPASIAMDGSLSYIAPGQLARALRDLGLPNPTSRISGNATIAD